MSGADILCEKSGACGLITLNRPKALNALTPPMVREMTKALQLWEEDKAVRSIVIRGGGGKAFCAGGDIRILYELGKAGNYDEQRQFWRDEYPLNRRIKYYPKPYLALTHGIVMGGGAGLSVHGAAFIVDEDFSFAMPEARIGLVPDIGATHFLSRLPFHAGTYLGLTGNRINGADALALGLASAFAPSSRHASLLQKLIDGAAFNDAIAAEQAKPPASPLMGQRDVLDYCFAPATLPDILARLDEESGKGSGFARSAARAIRANAPLSLALILRQMQIGKSLSLDEALVREYRLLVRLSQNPDFYEGVRALLIDKDNHPRWKPSDIEEISEGMLDSYFAALDEDELAFDGAGSHA
ncbi:MAG TPA: enoyl-CoA hydratase/isomerase family protein [Methylocella sp.]|nr:enoyl-CoA hydratase/isomerase family protein [Methylocella sp.]